MPQICPDQNYTIGKIEKQNYHSIRDALWDNHILLTANAEAYRKHYLSWPKSQETIFLLRYFHNGLAMQIYYSAAYVLRRWK